MPTRTGPQFYPGASQAYWYEDTFEATAMEVNVACLHTTEGTTVPTYADSQGRKGASAPNLTARPNFQQKKLEWFQHFRIDSSARALANRYGGVETNTLNVVQAELIGTCDPATHAKWTKAGVQHIYWPEAPAWALRDVAEFLAWLHSEHGVPLSGPVRWPAYPSSYANGAGQRMTGEQWSSFKGVCGHMHVPENDHGDPGAIDFPELLALAKAALGLPSTSQPNPPTTKPKYEPFPGATWFRKAPRSAIVTAMGKRLVAEGCSAYASGPGPQWTEADRKSYAKWQRKLGYTGAAADGWPGPASWAALKVPNV
ncbi:peptidoglycan-binding protein [Streptomyces bobili]|uniref:peptidoglycan-binding protein n=1 Tax=Streptomyces bobili TaxID=67280 RepID=UPI000A3ACCD4|nr:peptidoglycan-binding protein [Streptomyces bobili]